MHKLPIVTKHYWLLISLSTCSWIDVFFEAGMTFQLTNQIWGTTLPFMSSLLSISLCMQWGIKRLHSN